MRGWEGVAAQNTNLLCVCLAGKQLSSPHISLGWCCNNDGVLLKYFIGLLRPELKSLMALPTDLRQVQYFTGNPILGCRSKVCRLPWLPLCGCFLTVAMEMVSLPCVFVFVCVFLCCCVVFLAGDACGVRAVLLLPLQPSSEKGKGIDYGFTDLLL